MKLLPLFALALAACSTPNASLSYAEDHPATARAVAAPAYTPPALPPVPDATPPPPLTGSGDVVRGHGRMDDEMPSAMQPMGHGMDHGRMNQQSEQAMDHGQMQTGTLMPAASDSLARLSPDATTALRSALTAYLAIGDRLADDAFGGVPAEARTLKDAVARLSAIEVAGQPHFWHSRAALLNTLSELSSAVIEAENVAAARPTFGRLSVAFAELLAATGTPADLEVRRFTCGMYRDAPEGGVWLQKGEQARNPYYGSAMLGCHRSQAPVPARSTAQQPANHAGHH